MQTIEQLFGFLQIQPTDNLYLILVIPLRALPAKKVLFLDYGSRADDRRKHISSSHTGSVAGYGPGRFSRFCCWRVLAVLKGKVQSDCRNISTV